MTLVPDSDTLPGATLTLTRTFDAPRALVYRLWTDARYVALWWGIDGSTNPVCVLDVRPGGRWRIDMRTASGTVYPNGGEYLEVVENERLVYTDQPSATSPAWKETRPPGVAVHTVIFLDEGDRTRVHLHIRFASKEDRDRVAKTGFREGIGQSLDRLSHLLGHLKAGTVETVSPVQGR